MRRAVSEPLPSPCDWMEVRTADCAYVLVMPTCSRLGVARRAGAPEGNLMSNKPHQHPHGKQRTSRTTRLVVAIVLIVIFAAGLVASLDGHPVLLR